MRLRIIRYEVECALPPEAAVTVVYRGQSFRFAGLIRLGPGWLLGAMSAVEQERVSACLLARVNARGNTLRITLVGPYDGLTSLSAEERASYPNREATFVGNLFTDAPWAYVTQLACGSRACRVDLARSWCDCGLVSTDIPFCDYSPDSDYSATCTSWVGDLYANPITTWVVQEPGGGRCAADIECMSYNCSSGICGGLGAVCAWDNMCWDPVTCGTDQRCGGTGAVCTQNADCVSQRCDGRGLCR
jgi:hypothetical protein